MIRDGFGVRPEHPSDMLARLLGRWHHDGGFLRPFGLAHPFPAQAMSNGQRGADGQQRRSTAASSAAGQKAGAPTRGSSMPQSA